MPRYDGNCHSFSCSNCKRIDTSLDVALERFEMKVKRGKGLLRAAKGVLVFPRVIKAGFLFKKPIVGFVFSQRGLMADISLEGTKITEIKK